MSIIVENNFVLMQRWGTFWAQGKIKGKNMFSGHIVNNTYVFSLHIIYTKVLGAEPFVFQSAIQKFKDQDI